MAWQSIYSVKTTKLIVFVIYKDFNRHRAFAGMTDDC